MSELVRVRLENSQGVVEKSVSPLFAEANGLTVLDGPGRSADGRARPTTRANGRPAKKKTSVAEAAAAKEAKAPEPVASTPEEANE